MTRQEIVDFVDAFVKLRGLVDDEGAAQVPNLYPYWRTGVNYCVGDRVLYNEVLYKVLQAHTSQETWTPSDAPSLFAQVLTSSSGSILEWIQPESTNPYMKGDKVLHNGKTWESNIDNNVWEPGIYGWAIVDE